MQVEKRHSEVKLLLIILFYLSFLPGNSIFGIIIIFLIFFICMIQSALNNLPKGFIFITSLVFEVLSSGFIGLSCVQYLTVKCAISLVNTSFYTIQNRSNLVMIMAVTVLSIIVIVVLKSFYNFRFDQILYIFYLFTDGIDYKISK